MRLITLQFIVDNDGVGEALAAMQSAGPLSIGAMAYCPEHTVLGIVVGKDISEGPARCCAKGAAVKLAKEVTGGTLLVGVVAAKPTPDPRSAAAQNN